MRKREARLSYFLDGVGNEGQERTVSSEREKERKKEIRETREKN